jgi:hypothetical protein
MKIDDYEVRQAILQSMQQADQTGEKALLEQRDKILHEMQLQRIQMLKLSERLASVERKIATKEVVSHATRHYLDVLRMAA